MCLQALYNNLQDRSIKRACHLLCALAVFVPPEDVITHFETLQEDISDQVLPIADYLEVNYIRSRSRPTRGRRRALCPRYNISLSFALNFKQC